MIVLRNHYWIDGKGRVMIGGFAVGLGAVALLLSALSAVRFVRYRRRTRTRGELASDLDADSPTRWGRTPSPSSSERRRFDESPSSTFEWTDDRFGAFELRRAVERDDGDDDSPTALWADCQSYADRH